MKNLITLTTSAALLLASSTVSAKLIEGSINFSGGAVVDYNATEVISVDFYDTAVVSTTDSLTTGDFDGLETSSVAFFDIDTSATPSYDLWSVGGFTFEITSLDVNEVSSFSGLTLTSIAGNGIIYSTDSNLEATNGTWTVTTNGTSKEMSFSSSATAAVPAPAGAALLGLGLLGFGFARRNKKA